MIATSEKASVTIAATQRRLPELDGLRGLAIALVIAFHYVDVNSFGNKFIYYLSLPAHLGWAGVDLFFVLSGLLIGGILIDHHDSPSYYSTFYGRRTLRIFPLYYLLIAALIIGRWMFPGAALLSGTMPVWMFPIFAQNLTGHFTSAPPLMGVCWSLAVEEQFYLLLPFLVRHCARKTLVRVMIACVVGAPLLRTILILRGFGVEQVYPILPCRADALAFGVLAAIIIRSEYARSWVREKSSYLYGGLFALCALMPTLLKWTTFNYAGTVGYSVADTIAFLLIILLLLCPRPAMQQFFTTTFLRWLGAISYCAYLIHIPVREGVLQLLKMNNSALRTLSAAAITLALAYLSWILIERSIIKWAALRFRY
jgi:peptidoglycan/LPS O-acetylase OafA/YrhL